MALRSDLSIARAETGCGRRTAGAGSRRGRRGAEIQAEVNGPEIIITAEDGEGMAESAEPEEAPQEYAMALYYHYHVTGEQRKALVAAVGAFIDAPAFYQSAPTFAYAIGEYRVDKEGPLTGPVDEALILALRAKGFIEE